MDRLIKVNLANVSATDCASDSLLLEPSNVANCVSKGKSEKFDCRNHVRVIQPIGDGERLYVCGTNAHNPRDQVVYANLTALYDLGSGRREYSFKRTIKYDSHMLDKPDFVGSYEIGDHVYFFFREVAVEYMNCGKAVYSRVARVCKKDTGGKNILHQNWATYLKARLNCSIPGEFPFYFNEIQSVYKMPNDDTTFYGVFTTSLNGLMGSAVCTFHLDDVTRAFEGKFKEQESSRSAWLAVASSKVPEPRPGSCVEDTRELPDRVLNFMRTHPLMDEHVGNQGQAGPTFYKRDVIFTHIVVDQMTTGMYSDKQDYTIFYIGAKTGQIFKVSQWKDGEGRQQSQLLDVFQATLEGEAIRAMEISRRLRTLYVTSDSD